MLCLRFWYLCAYVQGEKVNRKWKGIKEHGNQVKLKMHSTNEIKVSLSFDQFLYDIVILMYKHTLWKNIYT